MQPVKFTDFLKLANIFYTSIGLQPYEQLADSKMKTIIFNLVFFVETINLNSFMLGEVTFVVVAFANGSNFVQAIQTMSYIGFVILADTKMFFVWRKKATLTKFVNGLQHMFPSNKTLQADYDLRVYLSRCSRISINFSLLYMMLIWTYNLLNIAKYIVCGCWLGMADIEQDLPYTIYEFWNWHDHWSYYVLYAAEVIAGYTSAAGQISSDLFLVACATQLIMHFDYLARKIKTFQCDAERSSCSRLADTQKSLYSLQNLTRYHINLLNLSEQINEIFGVPLLLNFISSSCVICFVGFQITVGASPEIMLKLFLFLISSSAQVYLICHFGQLLIDASTNIAFAAYDQEWCGIDTRYQKMLVLIALRAQKPVQLKATTFVLVSRSTMAQIMQLSYKFFALLRTMYST